jgi:hypothetical protein
MTHFSSFPLLYTQYLVCVEGKETDFVVMQCDVGGLKRFEKLPRNVRRF